MKNLIFYPKYALSTLLVVFVFLIATEAQSQIFDNFSRLRSEEGLKLQRFNHDSTAVRQCVMNFHTDVPNPNEESSHDHDDFDYVYLRATAENDTLNPNNLIVTSRGMVVVSESDKCRDLDKNIKELPDSLDIKLYVNGHIAVRNGNATNYVVSDAQFKKNVQPLKNSLEVIRNSNFVQYQYNNLSDVSSTRKYYGVLAHEMKEILPSTVVTARKKIRATDKQSTEFFMFNPNDLIYSGLDAIKELDKENQALKVKVEEEATKNEILEDRVSELERMLLTLLDEKETERRK